ncbi:MAG TPA: TlpA family protein disulfide reductase, partial [Thermoplasmata archaeon]|nr:TlpA family protein disulfide reductase [Thermoplasmata archaeon]
MEGVALWYEICQGETCLLAREVAMSPAWDDHTAEISFDRNGTVTFRIIATDGLGNEGVLHEGQFEVVVPPPADGGGDENGSGEPPEVEIPTSVLLTTITDGQEVSGRILLEGGAFDSPTIMVSIDGGEWNVVATHERRLSGRMPPFTLIDVDNGTFTLDDLLGRPVILDLMAISCSACEDLGAALATITEMYGDGVAVISVSVDPSDTANALRAYRDGHGHDWIYALDTAGLADDLGVEEIPHIVFLTADGHVSGEFTGAMTADEISVQIGLALSERVWSLMLDTTVLENGYHAITVRTEDGRTETFSIHVTNVGAASDGGDRDSDGDMTLLLAGLMVAVIAVAGVAAAA